MRLWAKLLSRGFLDERLVPELEADTVQYFDHLRRYLFAQQYVNGRRVLDIACGTGYGGDMLLRGGAVQVIGADISGAALRYAVQRRSALIRFMQADAAQLPLPDHTVDVIVSFETLEHLAAPEAFLAEAKRVLRPDGCLIISTPNRAVTSPGSATPFSPYHTFEPTRAELLDLLGKTGWQAVALHGIDHSPQAATTIRPARGAFARAVDQVAWSAYIRWLARDTLPAVIYRWLARWRHIPQLTIADSVLQVEATEQSMYFVALCAPLT
jgi:SAM-dependent methyltransferase